MSNSQNLNLKKLTIPIFFDLFLHFATLIINTYMVTQVSVDLVGAMGAGNQVMDLFMIIFSFLSVGCAVVVAQALGGKNKILAMKAVHTSLTFNTIFGLFCAIFIYIFGYFVLEILNVPQELIKESYDYLHLLGVALFFDGIGVVLAAVLRVYNLAFNVMIVSLVMNLITLFGNAIALFGWFGLPNYGLYAVALSTVIGRFIGMLILFYTLVKIAKVKIFIKMLFKFSFDILKKILSIGLPSAGENLLWMAQYMVAFSFVASMGKDSLSVQTIYFQIALLIMLCGTSISMANEVIVGHLVGAKRFEEAYKKTFQALKFGLIATIIVVLATYLAKDFIMQELSLDENLKTLMIPLFVLALLLEPGRTFNIVMVNALRASGDAKFPFMTGAIFMWGLSLPLGYFLGISCEMGILGVWLGFLADEWIRGAANTLRWKSKKWIEKRLV
ncbi:MAG: MATE family efflux transporter [Campylobacter sp.]